MFGWVQRQRDLGQLIFIDLRDRTGIIQLAFDEGTPREAFDKAFAARSEYVLAAKGVVRIRTAKNPDIPTGDVEIAVSELRVLGKAETPPFEIVENCATAEATRAEIPVPRPAAAGFAAQPAAAPPDRQGGPGLFRRAGVHRAGDPHAHPLHP